MLTTLHKVILNGQDLNTFLQGIMTQDIHICQDKPKLSTICNPYGKVVISFWVKIDTQATLWVDETLSESLVKTIKYYDPFSELSIEIDSNYAPITDIYDTTTDPWPLVLIKNNIITLTPDTQSKFTPHILCLSDNAISYTKGCFIGHEPIARTHFKGKVKRKLCYLTSRTKPLDALNLYLQDSLYHYLTIQQV
jgi:folate-binding protein YgfZ